jgi:hypothetical protein
VSVGESSGVPTVDFFTTVTVVPEKSTWTAQGVLYTWTATAKQSTTLSARGDHCYHIGFRLSATDCALRTRPKATLHEIACICNHHARRLDVPALWWPRVSIKLCGTSKSIRRVLTVVPPRSFVGGKKEAHAFPLKIGNKNQSQTLDSTGLEFASYKTSGGDHSIRPERHAGSRRHQKWGHTPYSIALSNSRVTYWKIRVP